MKTKTIFATTLLALMTGCATHPPAPYCPTGDFRSINPEQGYNKAVTLHQITGATVKTKGQK